MSDTLDRERLGKLLGMLDSAHDGEIAAAGRAADRLVRAAGLRWPDVLQPALPLHPGPGGIGNPDDAITFCAARNAGLNPWERRFIESLVARHHGSRGRSLSDKQIEILQRLVVKCRGAERAAA